MKTAERLIKVLNDLLADELTAISQYMVHAEMCSHWGYGALHSAIEKQAIDEMHHAEWLIERILFLEGTPIVSKLNKIRIGKTIQEMIGTDREDEIGAIKSYNAAIALAEEVGDQSTADLLTNILKMEEEHTDWADKQRTQIEQMGMQTYLGTQRGQGEK